MARQAVHNIRRVQDEPRALPDEEIRTPTGLRSDVSRDGQDFATLLKCKAGGDGASAVLGTLDDDNGIADAADNAVAQGEVLWVRGCADGELRENEPLGSDFPGEVAILRGVDVVNAAAEDGDGLAPVIEASPMGMGIDAAGHAANDAEAHFGEVSSEFGRDCLAISGGTPGADKRDVDFVKQIRITKGKQDEGRIGNLPQAVRVKRVRKRENLASDFDGLLDLSGRLLKGATAGDGLGYGSAEASGFKVATRGEEHIAYISELFNDTCAAPVAKARYQGKGEPVEC